MAKEKTFKAKRCKHMPTKDNTVVIFSSKHGKGIYKAGFTIGNQDFTVGERETKEEVVFMCNMLETAFKNLVKTKVIQSSDDPRLVVQDITPPKIKIINKK